MSVSEAFGQLGDLVRNFNVDNELSRSLAASNDDSIFEEEPVDLDTFLYDEKYLNLSITLSQPQWDFIDNCSRLFESPIYTEAILQCGQGSGKDTCSVFLCLRIVYYLLCLKSPQKYFNMGSKSFIDIINVAPTDNLAKKIFFDTLISYMEDSPYFSGLEPIRNMVIFPKKIRLHSSNSVDESWQGLTPILIVLDEIDAFKSEVELQKSRSLRSEGAEGVYNTAKALVQSRFPGVGKVLCLSWPRFKGSFIQKKFLSGKGNAKTYVPCREDGTPYPTWEFNTARKREDFQGSYDEDPVLAMARFECNPPFATDAFIKDPIVVLNAFDAAMDEFGNVAWAGNNNLRTGGIRLEDDLLPNVRYYIHVDLGVRQANAALCISHYSNINSVIIDLVKVWKPTPGKDVKINDIERFILNLRNNKGFRIEECSYDGYQSLSAIQNLTASGINTIYKSVSRGREAYDTLKDLIYAQRIDGYYDEDVIREILGLNIVIDKVEARPGALKDRADAIAGSVHGVMKGQQNKRDIKDVGELGSMFGKPDIGSDKDVSVFEFVDKNTGKAPRMLGPKLDAKGFVVSDVFCLACNTAGSVEYSGLIGRVLTEEGATNKWCILCRAMWDRPSSDENWNMIRDSNKELLQQVTRG